MTTTFLTVIALAGSLVPTAPGFHAHSDYSHAMKRAATENKPVVVLIAQGNAFATLLNDANLTAEAKKLLTQKCVCVAVNLETEAGRALASEFQMPNGGLVISSCGGSYQALRQVGTVTARDLSRHTLTYATATGTPTTTVTVGAPATSYYQAPVYVGGCSGGSCGRGTTILPASYPATPVPASYPATPVYGGCSNGRCPTPIYIR
ncbi:MAG: hypothetical protein RMJ56_09745 [Gemmataceae bacterium]|nr:hypothetical protein [Gemmata sp.]MDW8197872.1 hypothetical protein [Gemmataceae bacterium]